MYIESSYIVLQDEIPHVWLCFKIQISVQNSFAFNNTFNNLATREVLAEFFCVGQAALYPGTCNDYVISYEYTN